MNNIDFSQPNGFPLKADTLGFMQDAYKSAISGLAQLAGAGNVIISGCTDSGATISDGWVYFQNELFFFQGGVKSQYFILDQTIEADTNQNGQSVDRYFTRKLRFGSGANQYDFSNLERIESLSSIKTKLYFAFFDSAIIVIGLNVQSVTSTTVEVSPGVAMIDNKFVNVGAYNGLFPAYVNSDGQWVNTQPSLGDYITFNPKSSQYLNLIYKRKITMPGEIILQVVDISSFDNTGLGRWEYEGFALANGDNDTVDLRGRVILGYDERTTDPVNQVWDSNYSTLGNIGGEKKHALTIPEMPRHNHQANGVPSGPTLQNTGAGEFGLIRKSQAGQGVTVGSIDSQGSGSEPDVLAIPTIIPYQGDNVAHENRQPYMVLAYIQRVNI